MNIQEMKEQLIKASDAYYNSDTKIMSDEDYDKLLAEYTELTGETLIGASPRVSHIVEVDHKYNDLAGTLSKTQNPDEVEDWLHKLGLQQYKLAVTPKFDGNSVIEEQRDGKVVMSLTRGKDGKGKDITDIMKLVPKDKHWIASSGNYGVKSEVIMTYADFNKFIEDTGEKYANPRSIVAGILNSDDGYKYAEYLTVVPLWLRGDDIKTREDELMKLQSSILQDGLYIVEGTLDEVIKDIKLLYSNYGTMRLDNTLEYMIDGLVIEVLDQDLRDSLGYTNSKKDVPKFAKALKFPYMEKASKVKDIEFWLSENGTGLITPVCYFEPVEFLGATHQKQSLQNYKRFKELSLGKGSPILVQLRNDVLSYIEKMDTDEDIPSIPFIDKCPVCGGDVIIDVNDEGEETRARCGNPLCPSKAKGMMITWLNKIGVKGVGTAIIDSMYEANIVKSIPDLYTFDVNKVCDLLGPVAGVNVKEAIDKVKSVYDYQVLGSLNIDNFSTNTAQLLFTEITWEEFYSIVSVEDYTKLTNIMVNINGIGPKKAKAVITQIKLLKPMLDELTTLVTINNYKDTLQVSDVTYNFVITGKLSRKRDDIVEELKSKGHKVSGSVTKNTDYLINNDTSSTTGKNKKAKELGVPIISEEELYKLI